MERQNPRLLAALAVQQFEESGDFLGEILDSFLTSAKLTPLDRNLFTELVYGTVRMKMNLDYIIQQFSTRRLEKIESRILQVLRVGVYQLFYLDRVPARAAVHEAVDSARRLGRPGAAGFVNGILRGILRGREGLRYPAAADEPLAYLSVRYSFPQWMVEDWLNRFGIVEAEELCRAFNQPAPTTLRINTSRLSVAEAARHFAERGAVVQAGRWAPDVITVSPGHLAVADELLSQGAYYIQDEGSALIAHAVGPQPGDFIHDLCSAPGGKTTHIAQLMGGVGEIWAWDISAERLAKVAENAERQGWHIIKLRQGDASSPLAAPQAHRVLVDAPCSGLGTMGHRPDVRWRRTPADVKELAELQRRILSTAASLVRPGGRLIYSVCTITGAEGEETAHWFLRNYPDFAAGELPTWFPADSGLPSHMRLLLPHKHGTDGFFVAVFANDRR